MSNWLTPIVQMYWFMLMFLFYSIFSFFSMRLYLFLSLKNILSPELDRIDLLNLLLCVPVGHIWKFDLEKHQST